MTEWIAIVTITCLAVISPGPDFAMVTRNALTLSSRAGLLTAVGVGAGVLVHVTYTLLGLGLLLRYSPWALDVMRLVGACYLAWLGLRLLSSQKVTHQRNELEYAGHAGRTLRVGFWTNALNPKTSVFIVSLFSQVVAPDTPVLVQLGYGVFISLAHIVWFGLVSVFFGTDTVRSQLMGMGQWIDRVFGVVLVSFAVGLILWN